MAGGDLPHIRIFISSPGDVKEERERAVGVVKQVQLYLQGRCVLEPYVWEDEPLLAGDDFQAQIDRPSKCDVAVFILWSRLGTPLSTKWAREDGTRPTGTEWEFEDARAACEQRGTPDVLVYRRKGIPPITKRLSVEEYALVHSEGEAVTSFFKRWFTSEEDGSFTAASCSYERADEFGDVLFKHLLGLLEKKLGGDGQPATWKGSPFRGLEAFQPTDAPIFFGRTRAKHALLQHLVEQVQRGVGFVLVLGMSGSGKSSLARAGLLPMLEHPDQVEADLEGAIARRALMRPGESETPFLALAAALLATEALPHLDDGGGRVALAQRLQGPETAVALIQTALAQAAREAKAAAGLVALPPARLVLLVDQLEELFQESRFGRDVQERFLSVLDALARSGSVWVVASLRSDFYEHVQRSPLLMALKPNDGWFDLEVPSPAEIGEMIRHPAQVAGLCYEVDPDSGVTLATVLEEEAQRAPEALPLLQYVLEQLYGRRNGITLTREAYRSLGGIEGALAARAEEVFEALTPEARGSFERVMRQLVEVGTAGEATRRYAGLRELEADAGAKELVHALSEARLLTSDRDRAGDGRAVVSVAHEALLRRWKRVEVWLKKDRELLMIRSRLETGAAQWHDRHQERSLLLPAGKPLADAESLVAAGIDLGETERDYLAASQKRARGVQRIKRFAVGAITVLAVGATGLGLLANAARQETSKALEDVLRLADVKKVRDLVEEEGGLWPIHPDRAAAMAAWVDRAETLAKRLPDHRQARERTRARGRQDEDGTWHFHSAEEDWQHQVLTSVIADLKGVEGEDGLLARVRSRRDTASTLAERSTERYREEWAETIQSVASSEKYEGLRLTPQTGLVPLGPDPDSGLFEFAHLGSGSLPTRDPENENRLVCEEDAAIVLVLLPGGSFRMGSEDGFDESPVHEVTLGPFFLAKHECTQAQWAAMTDGLDPSNYKPGKVYGDRRVTRRNPVEQISWEDCAGEPGWLRRHRLSLPSEAQWEYACRAGTDTPWFVGRDVTRLGEVANIADRTCKERGGPDNWVYSEEVDDGHVVHAVVGSFRANAFGLLDTHGNVWEWCEDEYHANYEGAPHDGGAWVDGSGPGDRVVRGGSWFNSAGCVRSASRDSGAPGALGHELGCRPARAITTD